MTKEIIEYVDINGKNYFKDQLDNLTTTYQKIIIRRLYRIEQGNYGDTTNEGSGIIDIRFIKEELRIYVSNINNNIVILLCGGDKSSKSKQNKDIQQAKMFLEEYKKEICNNSTSPTNLYDFPIYIILNHYL